MTSRERTGNLSGVFFSRSWAGGVSDRGRQIVKSSSREASWDAGLPAGVADDFAGAHGELQRGFLQQVVGGGDDGMDHFFAGALGEGGDRGFVAAPHELVGGGDIAG